MSNGDATPDDARVQKTPRSEGATIHAFSLDTTGLQRILGSLEAELMEAVWQLTSPAETGQKDWVSVGDVCRSLRGDANYKTVQTVMNRLVEKRLLQRRHRFRPHTYAPLYTRSALLARVTTSVLQGLIADFGDVALAQLVRALDGISPEQRAILVQLTRAGNDVSPDAHPLATDAAFTSGSVTGSASTGQPGTPVPHPSVE